MCEWCPQSALKTGRGMVKTVQEQHVNKTLQLLSSPDLRRKYGWQQILQKRA